jgi:hypothetical protein
VRLFDQAVVNANFKTATYHFASNMASNETCASGDEDSLLRFEPPIRRTNIKRGEPLTFPDKIVVIAAAPPALARRNLRSCDGAARISPKFLTVCEHERRRRRSAATLFFPFALGNKSCCWFVEWELARLLRLRLRRPWLSPVGLKE